MKKLICLVPVMLLATACNGGGTKNYTYNSVAVNYTVGNAESFLSFDPDHFFKTEAEFTTYVSDRILTDNKGTKHDKLTFKSINLTNSVVDEKGNKGNDIGEVNPRDVSEYEKTTTCNYGKFADKYHFIDLKFQQDTSCVAVLHKIAGNSRTSYGSDGYKCYSYSVYDNELVFDGDKLTIKCDFDFTFSDDIDATPTSVIKGSLTLSYTKA